MNIARPRYKKIAARPRLAAFVRIPIDLLAAKVKKSAIVL